MNKKFNNSDELQILLNEMHPNKYIILSEYKSVKEKIKVKYIKCGCESEVWVEALYKGCDCRKHMKTTQNISHDEFCEKINNKYPNKYIIMSEYSYYDCNIKVQYVDCGCIRNVKAGAISAGRMCAKHIPQYKTVTTEEFIERLEIVHPKEYKLLEPIQKMTVKINVVHLPCGTISNTTPQNLLINNVCRVCNKKTYCDNDSFRRYISNKYPDKYIFLSDYVNETTNIKIKVVACGCERYVRPSFLSKGRNCKMHLKRVGTRKSNKVFINELREKYGDEFQPLEPYQKDDIKIKFRHSMCNREFYAEPGRLLSRGRCGYCIRSNGEQAIYRCLLNMNIKFFPQYTNENCKYKRRLPFDFALFDDYDNLMGLIEFQGIQHYDYTEFRRNMPKDRAEIKFKAIKLRDSIKKQYCENNNIPFLEICYKDINKIQPILLEFLDLISYW